MMTMRSVGDAMWTAMKKTTGVVSFSCLLLLSGLVARAETSADQIPPSVEAERAALEAKFTGILNEECSSRLCTPVGCEIVAFRTLDQKQNSSLPGLDMGDDQPSQLQYQLSSVRCDFTYEPVIAAEAVANLRERVQEKIRQAGVSLTVAGRKLNPASPSLREAPKDAPALAPTPVSPSPWAPLLAGLPQLAMVLAITFGLIALIWAFRRVGRPKPIVIEAAPEVPPVPEDPIVREVADEKAKLSETFAGQPELAQATFEPMVREAARGQTTELAQVLNEFGPATLSGLASRAEYRDVFAQVREAYAASSLPVVSNEERLAFFRKISRLLSLARLEAGERPLEDDLYFLRDLTPDEFLALASDLDAPEMLTLLSFAPESLRGRVLRAQDEAFRETFVRHLLGQNRIAEREVRRIARAMRERFSLHFGEIKNATPAKLPLLEQVMNTLDGASRRRLVAQMKAENSALFNQMLSHTLLDKALAQVPANALNDVFLSLDPEEAAAYLGSHPDRALILTRLKGPLSQSVESRLKARYGFGLALDFVEDSPLAQTARQKVNAVLQEKSSRGELNIRRLNEAVVEQSLA